MSNPFKTYYRLARQHTAEHNGFRVVFMSKANPKSLFGAGELFWEGVDALRKAGHPVVTAGDMHDEVLIDGRHLY